MRQSLRAAAGLVRVITLAMAAEFMEESNEIERVKSGFGLDVIKGNHPAYGWQYVVSGPTDAVMIPIASQDASS